MKFIQLLLSVNLISNTWAYPVYLGCDGTFVKGGSDCVTLMAALVVMSSAPVTDASILVASAIEVAVNGTIQLTFASKGKGAIQADGGSLFASDVITVNPDACIVTSNQIIYYGADMKEGLCEGSFTSTWVAPSTPATIKISAATAPSFGTITRTQITVVVGGGAGGAHGSRSLRDLGDPNYKKNRWSYSGDPNYKKKKNPWPIYVTVLIVVVLICIGPIVGVMLLPVLIMWLMIQKVIGYCRGGTSHTRV